MYDTLEKPPKIGGASGIITPEVLAPQKPITLPHAPVPVEPTGIVSRATSLQQSLAAQQQKAAEDAKLQVEAVKADKTGLRSKIDQLFQGTLGRGEEQKQLYEQAGITQQEKDLAELIERTTTLNNAFNTQYAAQEGQGRGQVQPFISGQQAAIRRQQAVEIGNLSALAQAKQGNIQMAKDTIKETLDYKYADARAQVEYELSALDALGEDLTKAEQAQKEARQALLQSQLQEIETAKAEETKIQEIALEVAKNGADNSNLEAIRRSTTIDEAITKAAHALTTPETDVVELANGNTVVIDKRTGKVISNLGGAKPTEGGAGGTVGATGTVERDVESIMNGTLNLNDISTAKNYRASVAGALKDKQKAALESNDMPGVMRASAVYDKEPSDTFLQSMEKTLTVLDQIGTLQQNIAGVKTGPLVGAFKANNPWDTQGQVIKAQLNAIVPNLARGVYGEVGVLTDNDIKTYAKTLPNLTSTEEIRNAILYITVDQIRKNVEAKIKNQAAGQRDMSGYADIYTDLQAQAQSILGTLPNGAQNISSAQPSQNATATLDAFLGTGTKEPNELEGLFGKIFSK